MNKQKTIQAGKIAKQAKEFAKTIIRKDVSLLEIAEAVEGKIIELGGKPAFPVNLSINDVAAHYTPTHDDETKAHGLLKIDLGVHIDGWIADTAFSVDLEDSEENKKLIQASEEALNNAIDLINSSKASEVITTSQIGAEIQKTIEAKGFSPIINLTGHSIEQYELHSGITIPNIDDNKDIELEKGIYAIEPFATSGNGRVYDGKPSGIYVLQQIKPIRSPLAREILEFIEQEYATLPFCSRWLVKKFTTKALFAIKQLEQAGILHEFAQLVETSHKPVSQAENTILIEEGKVVVTTL